MELDQELFDYLYCLSILEDDANSLEEVSPASTAENPSSLSRKRNLDALEGVSKANKGKIKLRASEKLKQHSDLSPVDPSWELIDPTPDVHALFVEFDREYFWGRLPSVMVSWSSRMTLCAGICTYRRGASCQIRLSLPLLKLRPRKDLVETLLHEMIHAYLFLHSNERESHGPLFHQHMRRINEKIGSHITVYHTFDEEVSVYKRHWWRCNGRCQNERPFFGYVKRSMNRVPSHNDTWWASHQASCGGTFIKIREPKSSPKGKKQKEEEVQKQHGADIRNFILTQRGSNTSSSSAGPPTKAARKDDVKKPAKSNDVRKPAKSHDVKKAPRNDDVTKGPRPDDVKKPAKSNDVKKSPRDNDVTEVHRGDDVSKAPTQRFPGQGLVLGGGSTKGRSRLLDLCEKSGSMGSSTILSQPRPASKPLVPRHSPTSKSVNASHSRQGDIRTFFGSPDRQATSQMAVQELVNCPCCVAKVPAYRINEHLDSCIRF